MQALRRWDAFWFAPMDAGRVAAFRVALAGCLLAWLLTLAPAWELFYGPAGLGPLEPLRPWNPLSWASPWAVWAAAAAAAAALAAGRATRLCCLVLYAVLRLLAAYNPLLLTGEDVFLRMMLFFCLFVRLDGSGPAWPLRLIQVCTAMLYLMAAVYKIDGGWLRGEALHDILASSHSSRWPWTLGSGPFTAAAAWAVVGVELAFPLAAFSRRWSRPAVLAMAALNLGMALLLRGVSFFALSMLVPLVLFSAPAPSLPGRGTSHARPSSGRTSRASKDPD